MIYVREGQLFSKMADNDEQKVNMNSSKGVVYSAAAKDQTKYLHKVHATDNCHYTETRILDDWE